MKYNKKEFLKIIFLNLIKTYVIILAIFLFLYLITGDFFERQTLNDFIGITFIYIIFAFIPIFLLVINYSFFKKTQFSYKNLSHLRTFSFIFSFLWTIVASIILSYIIVNIKTQNYSYHEPYVEGLSILFLPIAGLIISFISIIIVFYLTKRDIKKIEKNK